MPEATPGATPPPTPEAAEPERKVVVPPPAAMSPAEAPPVPTPALQGSVRKGGPGDPGSIVATPAPRRAAASAVSRTSASTAPATASLWTWFTNGNTMARIGIVVLFFGIAFLLSYLAEHVTIPIELQFAGVALAGGAR